MDKVEDVDHLSHRGRTLEVSFPVLLEEEYFSDIKKNDPNKKKQKKRSHSVDVEPPSSQHQQGCNRRNSISSIRNKSSLVPNEENSTISDDLLNFEEIVQEFSRTRFLDKPMKDALLRKREPAPESEHITEAFKKVSDNQTACPGKLTEADIPRLRQQWMESCQELLNGVPEELPPMRGVNHHILLIDDNKRYNYHLPRCPDAFKPQLLEKIGLYTRAGWWESVQTDQAAPMLCIPKKDGKQLRTAIDCRKRNDNTRKDVTPFPDQDQIRLEVAHARYRSKIDFSQAFEQIRVVPEDVWKTAFATIYGTFVSHTMQIGDCNAPATFQRVMTMIFRVEDALTIISMTCLSIVILLMIMRYILVRSLLKSKNTRSISKRRRSSFMLKRSTALVISLMIKGSMPTLTRWHASEIGEFPGTTMISSDFLDSCNIWRIFFQIFQHILPHCLQW
jgi:hypothetical protein